MTSYEVVFKSFLSKVQDPIFSQMEIEVAEDDMNSLLNSAILNFEYPKMDLKDKDDELKQFNNTLTLDEIEILGHLMAYEWMSRGLQSIDLISQNMTTKDFNTFSQANHINSLTNTLRRREKQIRQLKIKYNMRDGNQPDLHGLGGGAR